MLWSLIRVVVQLWFVVVDIGQVVVGIGQVVVGIGRVVVICGKVMAHHSDSSYRWCMIIGQWFGGVVPARRVVVGIHNLPLQEFVI